MLPHTFFDEFVSTLTDADFRCYQTTHDLETDLKQLHGVSDVFLANGSDSVISAFLQLFLPGTRVVTTTQHFPMYDVYCDLFELVLSNDEVYDDAVAVISNPSSPSGKLYSLVEISAIASRAEYVLVDEAYIDYAPDGHSAVALLDTHDNIVVSRSLSKGLGAAGCRIGYAMGSTEMIAVLSKFRSMFPLAGPSIQFARFILKNYKETVEYCRQTATDKANVLHAFSTSGYRVFSSNGNWIHVEQTNALVDHLSANAEIRHSTELPGEPGLWVRLTVFPGMHNHTLIKEIPRIPS